VTISSIQKRKFLNNLYQLLYSSGVSDLDSAIRQPREEEIKKEYDDYFSVNRLGLPLSVDVNNFRNRETTDPELMNFMLSRMLLNVEVLYDSVYENNQDLMKVVTVLNKRLEDVKSKRIELEKRVDDLLFSNSNTDGFFYSFSDSFSNLNNVDISLTSCYVDTEFGKVTLPKLKSSALDFSAPGRINLSNVKHSVIFNGSSVVTDAPLDNSSSIFDGLTNTYCNVSHKSNQLGACALILTIPLSTSFVVSKIQGKLATSSAVTTIVELIDPNDTQNVQYRRQQSNSAYDRFSFDFTPQSTGTVRITFIKYDADLRDTSNPLNQYLYNFNIKDIIVSGEYYDAQGTFVSSPISIPLGDENKIIDAVSVDASNGNPEIGSAKFYVARNVEGASNISDFDWIPVSSSTDNNSSFENIVSFNSSTKSFKSIDNTGSSESILLYPLSSDSNLSLKNPSTSIYNGISVNRIGKINQEINPYNSYILESINSFKFIYISYIEGLNRDKANWSSIINDKSSVYNISEPGNIQITNTPSIPIVLNLNNISGFLNSNLLVEKNTTISSTVSRNDGAIDWNMSVYLNGVSIVDFEPGIVSKEVVWNFIEGVNQIEVAFDAEGSSVGSISLMTGESIAKYGIPYLRYYGYVDPFDFRVNRTVNDYVFTIDSYLGNKEILCRNPIANNSRIYYRNNSEDLVSSIRFRADLSRFSNPFGTPTLSEYRIKFKNSN
jgi:hypothetical protein